MEILSFTVGAGFLCLIIGIVLGIYFEDKFNIHIDGYNKGVADLIHIYSLNELALAIHQVNIGKGFYSEPKNLGEMLALIHSEISEALEADRKDHYSVCGTLAKHLESGGSFTEGFEKYVKNTFEDEIADAIIRLLDLAKFKGIDIDWHIQQKLNYNMTDRKSVV